MKKLLCLGGGVGKSVTLAVSVCSSASVNFVGDPGSGCLRFELRTSYIRSKHLCSKSHFPSLLLPPLGLLERKRPQVPRVQGISLIYKQSQKIYMGRQTCDVAVVKISNGSFQAT